MKKQSFVLAILAIATLFVSNLSQAQKIINRTNKTMVSEWGLVIKPGDSVTIKSFNQVYLETLELNRSRFNNLNKIQIGDSVLISSMYVGGLNQYWVADAPWMNENGQHDCIYRLVQKYMNHALPTQPVFEPEDVTPPVQPAEETVFTQKEMPWWAWLVFALSVGGLLYLFLRDQIAQREKSRNNPDAFPPVITGGLSDNDEEARRQIAEKSNLSPNNIIRIQRGVLVRHSGVNEVLAMMAFGDHGRSMYIRPGERVTKVTLLKDSKEVVEYWRNHCGNRFGMIAANGQFIMPEGWEFVENQPTTENTSAAAAAPAPAPAPAPTPEPASELESMLTAISKIMPKGTKKFNLEYEINGGKKNKIKLDME